MACRLATGGGKVAVGTGVAGVLVVVERLLVNRGTMAPRTRMTAMNPKINVLARLLPMKMLHVSGIKPGE
jgi:hypothetical protein